MSSWCSTTQSVFREKQPRADKAGPTLQPVGFVCLGATVQAPDTTCTACEQLGASRGPPTRRAAANASQALGKVRPQKGHICSPCKANKCPSKGPSPILQNPKMLFLTPRTLRRLSKTRRRRRGEDTEERGGQTRGLTGWELLGVCPDWQRGSGTHFDLTFHLTER